VLCGEIMILDESLLRPLFVLSNCVLLEVLWPKKMKWYRKAYKLAKNGTKVDWVNDKRAELLMVCRDDW
jgi:hypothetical protein